MLRWLLALPFRFLYNVLKLFLAPRVQRSLNAHDAASMYLKKLENEYGPVHIPLAQTSYAEAVKRAKHDFRFLLVILTSEVHVATPAMHALMCDETLRSYILEHDILVWAGNVAELEAYRVSTSLGVGRYPFVGVVVSDPELATAMICVAKLEGSVDLTELLTCLQEAIDTFGPSLISFRADRQEQNLSRTIREEQDAAYESSLRKDRERAANERQAREEAQNIAAALVAREQNAIIWRRKKATELSPEPLSAKDVSRISFRMPDGSRSVHKFSQNSSLEDVYTWVDLQLHPVSLQSEETSKTLPDNYEHPFDFTLAIPMPRRVLNSGPEKVVEHRELYPSGSLVVEEISMEDER